MNCPGLHEDGNAGRGRAKGETNRRERVESGEGWKKSGSGGDKDEAGQRRLATPAGVWELIKNYPKTKFADKEAGGGEED